MSTMRDSNDKIHLQIYEQVSSIRTDGSRATPYPADVRGRFTSMRKWGFGALILIWTTLPWIQIGGRPAMFLDVPTRRFFLFGFSFNAQDVWLVFFVLTALLFALVVATAFLGRAWCGWACPQTVFLEGLYRPIERLIEGPRNEQMRRDAAPMSWSKLWRKALKHSIYIVISLFVAHVFLAYFVSLPSLFEMVTRAPSEHLEAFLWMLSMTLLFWGNFGWFREQLCLVVCPYGRMQSILLDDDSLVVGYDKTRGEPRARAKGKGKAPEGSGDCVDCNRCVVVCPTGIDIRNGLQMDCIACTQCIDACDDVMDKLERPRGLIRYDSQRGLRGEKRKIWRPRLAFYGVLGLIGTVVAGFAFRSHSPFEANLVRMQGAPYVVERGAEPQFDIVRNQFQVHVFNKQDGEHRFHIDIVDASGADVVLGETDFAIEALGSRRVSVIVREERSELTRGEIVHLRVTMEGEDTPIHLEAPLLGPVI